MSAFPSSRMTTPILVKASSFVVCAPPLPCFIAEGRWVSWPAGDLVTLLRARSESCHGCHSSRQAQLALSPFYGLEGRAADRGSKGECHFNAGGRWWAALLVGLHRGARGECRFDAGERCWAALVVVLHRGARGEWEHGGTGW